MVNTANNIVMFIFIYKSTYSEILFEINGIIRFKNMDLVSKSIT